jgi:hypothetical protein
MAAREGLWNSSASGAAVVAGGEGIGTIAVEDKTWRQVIGIGVVVTAALAAYSTARASSYSDSFKEGKCVDYLSTPVVPNATK